MTVLEAAVWWVTGAFVGFQAACLWVVRKLTKMERQRRHMHIEDVP